MSIDFNTLVDRQTPESPYTHFVRTKDELLGVVKVAFRAGKFIQGYRDGVVLVRVDCQPLFRTGMVTLQEGDELIGEYKPRKEGEHPRQSIRVRRSNPIKTICACVEVVLYRHDVLLLNNEASTDADWEIVAINGYDTEFPEDKVVPMDPMTLMHNHFESDGGTATDMTPEQFEEALKESFEFHKDKGLLDSPVVPRHK